MHSNIVVAVVVVVIRRPLFDHMIPIDVNIEELNLFDRRLIPRR